MEYPFIVGTAGHIDHGKTSLVKAMTGVDCDRLEEEKRRGITIELGFAPLNLASGKTVSIVDVPGHERFIRQMAAGAAGMDAAMLIIAASEGVMPQTREHLDILNLLGVRCGLVALTKKDLVDEETLEMAKAEALELIQGSCLAGAAVIPVSAATGEGLGEVLAEIENLLGRTPPRKGLGAFFLPIDRVFSKKGFGSVITGTIFQGSLAEGEEIELLPSGLTGKARFLQAHGAKVPAVKSGQRAAVNLSSITHDKIERGDVACAKGAFIPSDCMSAWVEMLPGARGGLEHWQRVRLHIGTADVAARVSLLRLGAAEKSKGYPAGTGGAIQILPESKITAMAGQHFIIRFYSPLVTIGGGRVLLPNAVLARNKTDRAGKSEAAAALNSDFNPAAFLAALVRDRGVLNAAGLFELSQMQKNDFAETLETLAGEAEKREILEFGKSRNFMSAAALGAVAASAQKTLQKFHAQHPELAGLDGEKLHVSLDAVNAAGKVSAGDFKELLGIMAAKKLIGAATVQGKTFYKAAGFSQSADTKFAGLVAGARDAIEAAGFSLLTEAELEAKAGIAAADTKRVLAYLREQDDLRVIKEGLLFSRQMRDKLLAVLADMKEEITVASLRDSLGLSRKYTLPMLEFFDSQGLTQRDGDKRVLAKK
ncbi:MAG: selenocysteine-specific translation elongation factor [Spirochaetes bacterium]|nr:selenocysteine-specific translation elongation factor [Spirochaetota bacterium]